MRFYESLGLETRLTLNLEDLKTRFYERSRQWHPDRFSRASTAEQQQALENTAILNDAYRTLRDPVKRAEYVLAANGFDIGEQRSKNVPPELLEEVFELNMALEEIRGGDDSVRQALEEAREKFVAMREDIDAELAGLFARYDESQDRAVLEALRGVLNRRRYIENLVRDVDKELTVHAD